MIVVIVYSGMLCINEYHPDSPQIPVEEIRRESCHSQTYTLKDCRMEIPEPIGIMYDQKIRRSPDPYRLISIRHTSLSSNIASGHRQIIYWMRIRSRTWSIVIEPTQVEIVVILILIF